MNMVDSYFLKKTDMVSFIELKKGARLNIGDCIVEDGIPLPIPTDTLLKEIKNESADELQVPHVINGIIYIIGIDGSFKYKELYTKMLYSYDSKIEDFILHKGFEYIGKNNYEVGIIFFRALTHMNKKNIQGIFNYALCLESLAKKFINNNKRKKGNEFLLVSMSLLEDVLDISEEFAPAYYKLGYYYKYFNQFVKAKLIWERYIRLKDDNEHLQEIREQLESLTDDVKFEEGLDNLNRGEYKLALESFLELTQKYKTWWNVFYLSGLAYKGLGDYENAVTFFDKAVNLHVKNVDVYNELGICLFNLGEVDRSIDVFSEGIELDNKDCKIIFNRGMIYEKLGLIDRAYKDINKAHALNPDNNTIKNKMLQLKVLMQNTTYIP